MSDATPFSNPAGEAQEATDQYVQALLDLLGDQDPFAVQEATVGKLRGLVEGLSREELRRPERAGKWSIAQVVGHLADTEVVCGYRLRLVLAEARPAILGYDQELWAENLGYPAEADDVDATLEEMEVARRRTLRLLRRLDEEEWARYGVHSERGEESVRRLFRLVAAHDLVHLAQVRRILAAQG